VPKLYSFLDRHPRQLAAIGRELVAAARQLLFPRKQFTAGSQPPLARCDFCASRVSPSFPADRDGLPWCGPHSVANNIAAIRRSSRPG